jgi:phage-related baseplate assembly protein
MFSRRAWRRNHKVTNALLSRAVWSECPACKQTRSGEYWGRVIVRGTFAAENDAAIRRRILNVAEHAQVTQPERRVVSAARDGNVLEVLTTSQKLAHRIVHELKKAFHGRAHYDWSDDGSLFAVWERDS